MSRLQGSLSGGHRIICFITAGFPSAELSVAHALACVDGGADVIELGVPFSDPVADGRVIQHTSQIALEHGMTPRKVLDVATDIRRRTNVPIVLMGYYNPIFQIGEARYAQLARKSGADGLIVPDLPYEESGSLREQCLKEGLDLVQMVGPTTPADRMRRIAAVSSGFLYVVSSLGTTGVRGSLPANVEGIVHRAKECAGGLPIGVGFGITRRRDVAALHDWGAEAAIVGSAILQGIIDGWSPQESRRFIKGLKGP